MKSRMALLAAIAAACISAASAAKLTVGSTTAAPGETAEVRITYVSEGFQAVGVQFDLLYDTSILSMTARAGAAASAAGKSVGVGTAAGNRQLILVAGLDLQVIGDGVLTLLNFQVDSTAATGEYPVQFDPQSVLLIDSQSAAGPQTVENGIVTVEAGTPVGPPVLRFAQFADGDGIARTRIVLRLNGDSGESGEIRFRNPAGEPVAIPVGGTPASKLAFSLQPWGSAEILTDGTGTLTVGSIEVTSMLGAGSKLEGTEIFDIFGNNVSVSSAARKVSQQVYVSVNLKENTGVAAFNPDPGEAVVLDLYLLDDQGVLRTQTEMTLLPLQQQARFVATTDDALFKAFFEANPNYGGTLNIHARSGSGVVILGLLQKLETGALISVPTSEVVFDPN